MSRRELAAAGITDPVLRASYDACRRVNAASGRTFYLATLLLPPRKRPAVHALYAFARRADDIVDSLDPASTLSRRERDLERWTERFAAGAADDPIVAAVQDTITRHDIPQQYFEDFMTSMHMDLTTAEYATWEDLQHYMHGSAAVIGLQMLHVLGTLPGRDDAAVPYARDLGIAFQLTNFIRDVGEDLRRDRVYLPKADLAQFDVTRNDLGHGVVTANIRHLLGFEIDRARALYRAAQPGIDLLDPDSRDCIRTAAVLYGEILDAVEAADYDVFAQRAAVSRRRRAAVAVPAMARAWRTRRTRHISPTPVAPNRQLSTESGPKTVDN